MQQQVRSFVGNMVWVGAAAFLIVLGFNYYQSEDLIKSFLQGLTLAMSILPEEIPVAFSTFQALGAFRLLLNNIIVKQPQYVETLGSVTVICVDKTGTLTQNKMSIEYLYDARSKISILVKSKTPLPEMLIEHAMWSSETNPFDPMEKAIQYIVSIHIPIILIVTLPLLMLWKFTDIFSPVHVIFLELIMGPTCSTIYENEPMEPGIMNRPPRKMGYTFLTWRQLSARIVQGIMITAGCLGIGYYYMQQGNDSATIRTIIFVTLLFSNIFLTLVNRSFHYSMIRTIRYKNNLEPLIIAITLIFIAVLLYVPFARSLFRLNPISLNKIAICILAGLVSAIWIEIIKLFKNNFD